MSSVDLVEGEYDLEQRASANHVLQVKLTDSAIKAFEAYNHYGSSQEKCSIKFENNKGTLKIPGQKDGTTQTFTFQLGSTTELQYIQQHRRSGHSNGMKIVGKTNQKITVNANDDSYQTTRNKITDVKNLKEQTSTKVLKDINSKIEMPLSQESPEHEKDSEEGSIFVAPEDHKEPEEDSIFVAPESPGESGKRKRRPQQQRSSPPIISQGFVQNSTTAYNNATSASAHRTESPVTAGAQEFPGKRNKTKPKVLTGGSGGSTSSQTQASATKSHDEKTAVIHLLALGQVKLMDLQNRLNRYNTSTQQPPANTQQLVSILNSVGTFEMSSNGERVYQLEQYLFSGVTADWSGYSDNERNCIRKKKAVEIRSSHQSQAPVDYTNAIVGSKKRVSRVTKQPNPSAGSSRPPVGASGGPKSISPQDTRERSPPSITPVKNSISFGAVANLDIDKFSSHAIEAMVAVSSGSSGEPISSAPLFATQQPPPSFSKSRNRPSHRNPAPTTTISSEKKELMMSHGKISTKSSTVSDESGVVGGKRTSSGSGDVPEKRTKHKINPLRDEPCEEFKRKYPKIKDKNDLAKYEKLGRDLERKYWPLQDKMIQCQDRYRKLLDHYAEATSSRSKADILKKLEESLKKFLERSDYRKDKSEYEQLHGRLKYIARRVHDYKVRTNNIRKGGENFDIECLLVKNKKERNPFIISTYRRTNQKLPEGVKF